MEKPKNLDLYKRVSEFKEQVSTEQRLTLKVQEVTMISDNIKNKIAELDSKCSEILQKDYVEKSDLAVIKSLIESQKQQMQDTHETQKQGTSDSLEALRKDVYDNFVQNAQLSAYNDNVELTINDFVINNSTPRSGIDIADVEKVKTNIKDLFGKVDLLFSKFDSLKSSVVSLQNDSMQTEPPILVLPETVRSQSQVPTLKLVRKK